MTIPVVIARRNRGAVLAEAIAAALEQTASLGPPLTRKAGGFLPVNAREGRKLWLTAGLSWRGLQKCLARLAGP
jgi:hypothetical protein